MDAEQDKNEKLVDLSQEVSSQEVVSAPSQFEQLGDAVGDILQHAEVVAAGILRRDLTEHILNPLDLNIGSVLKIDHALGGDLTVVRISRVDSGLGEFADYLLQHTHGEEPEFVKLRVTPGEGEQEASARILGLEKRTSHDLGIEDSADESSNVYKTEKGEDFIRIGDDPKGEAFTLLEVQDKDGDRVAERGEISHREVRSWGFTKGGINGSEFLYIESDNADMMDVWRGTDISLEKVSALSDEESAAIAAAESKNDLISDTPVAPPKDADIDSWLGTAGDQA